MSSPDVRLCWDSSYKPTPGGLLPLSVKMLRSIASLEGQNLLRGTNWSECKAETLLNYNFEVDWNETPGFLWYDCSEDRSHPIVQSPSSDDDGLTYSGIPG